MSVNIDVPWRDVFPLASIALAGLSPDDLQAVSNSSSEVPAAKITPPPPVTTQ